MSFWCNCPSHEKEFGTDKEGLPAWTYDSLEVHHHLLYTSCTVKGDIALLYTIGFDQTFICEQSEVGRLSVDMNSYYIPLVCSITWC